MSKAAKLTVLGFCLLLPCFGNLFAQAAPRWVSDKDKVYPAKDWIAVVQSAPDRDSAQNAAFNDLAKYFEVDVRSVSASNQRFAEVVEQLNGKKNTVFTESRDIAKSISTASAISGLIGVESDLWTAKNGTVYANARMNRKECAARYAGMIRENEAVINDLLAAAKRKPATFDAYAALNFAEAIAAATDNFQKLLEVLDTTAVNRKPSYGSASPLRYASRNVLPQLQWGCASEQRIATMPH